MTGSWTLLTGAFVIGSTGLPIWLGWCAIPIGGALLITALEFVGRNESDGWWVAERVTSIAYVAWSLWRMVWGVALLLT